MFLDRPTSGESSAEKDEHGGEKRRLSIANDLKPPFAPTSVRLQMKTFPIFLFFLVVFFFFFFFISSVFLYLERGALAVQLPRLPLNFCSVSLFPRASCGSTSNYVLGSLRFETLAREATEVVAKRSRNGWRKLRGGLQMTPFNFPP